MLHYFFLVFDRVMSVFWTTYCFPRHPSVPTFSVHSKCLFNRYSRPLSIFSCWCNKTTVSWLFSRVRPIPDYLISYWQVFSQTLLGFFKFSFSFFSVRVDFQCRVKKKLTQRVCKDFPSCSRRRNGWIKSTSQVLNSKTFSNSCSSDYRAKSKTYWPHNHVYILSCKHSSQPIRTRVLSYLFYKKL